MTVSEGYENYLCDYWHDGATWSIEVPARSRDDAEARLRQIGRRGEVKGPIQAKIKVRGSWMRALASWLTGSGR